MNSRTFNKKSRVIERFDSGAIKTIKRGRDGRLISVGDITRSGKVLELNFNNQFAGGMYASLDRIGLQTAVPNIVLDEDDYRNIKIES